MVELLLSERVLIGVDQSRSETGNIGTDRDMISSLGSISTDTRDQTLATARLVTVCHEHRDADP